MREKKETRRYSVNLHANTTSLARKTESNEQIIMIFSEPTTPQGIDGSSRKGTSCVAPAVIILHWSAMDLGLYN